MSNAFTFDIVRPYDMEVVRNVEPTVLAEYTVHRTIETLDLPKDAKPVTFHCRALTRNQRRIVREINSEATQREMAFRFGLLSVSNIPRKGSSLATYAVNRSKPGDAMDDTVLDELETVYGIGDADIDDVGAAIWGRSFLALGVQRKCAVPGFSQDAAIDQISKYLAERLKEAKTQLDAPSPSAPSSEKEPSTPPSSPPGDDAGGATATE